MSATTSAWMYPWDIHDVGVAQVGALLAEGDVGIANVAVSYHSLFATLPDNPRWHHVELPASAVYYAPDPAVWDGSVLQPTTSPLVAEVGDALHLAREVADAAGCATSTWTVCLHDSALAARHRDVAVRTLWDEPVTAAMCLRHPAVRDYARRLVLDVAARADRVQLESPCWTTLPHHRHAKLPAASPDVVARLVETCFCDLCCAAATAGGVEVDRLVDELRSCWATAHTTEITWASVLAQVDGLVPYLRQRTAAVTALAGELVSASAVPLEVVSFGDRSRTGMDLAALEQAGAAVRVLAYGPSAHVAQVLAAEASAQDRAADLHVGLSLLPEHTATAAELGRSAQIAREAGAQSLGGYHLGLVPAERRHWFAELAPPDGTPRSDTTGSASTRDATTQSRRLGP